jgi:Pyruvate/2-oxoacid:ferredoxin oxidoreductase delta subunit
MKPVINKRKCPMQGQICKAIPACPHGAILYIADKEAPLGGRIIIEYEKCDECGICVNECCGDAIDLI